jgi:type IV pilus assembly protein PilB
MRIQDKSKEIPGFDILGIQGKSYDYLQEALALPNGVCLVSGPTGSGKTNTLYASLKQLNKEDVNILTIEDPVEYQMKGLNQAQVHPDIDFTFATGLRAALRQDPDVIMIGEIRDYETIEIAIRAALTGHLVFSTIHTNSSVDTITRIQNMGIAGFLIAAAVKMVVAQRLVRRVCPDCKEESPISETERKDLQETIEKIHPSQTIEESLKNNMIFYRGKGCAKCHDTGYSGRVGLFEILMIKDEISEMIIKGATRGEMQYAAMHAGMITLKQDGIIKALEGKTSVEEVYRVANSM